MFTFEPYFEDRFYVTTLEGTMSADEARDYLQKTFTFTEMTNFTGYGVVTDMRKPTIITPEAAQELTEGMTLGMELGFKVAGRVFSEITVEMIRKLRESNVKAGFLAQYFYDKEKAMEWVKKILERHPKTPFITMDQAKEIYKRYPKYKLGLTL